MIKNYLDMLPYDIKNYIDEIVLKHYLEEHKKILFRY